MEHLILTETEFFRLIDKSDNHAKLGTAYHDFTTAVVSLCTDTESACRLVFALSYAETELQYHDAMQDISSCRSIYARKALSFVRKMLKHLALSHSQVPPLSNLHSSAETPSENPAPPLQWTGNAIDLVELIYGIYEMGCINNGEMPLKQLAPLLYRIFGVEAKDCYRFYTDIKRRKTISHTHFLEQMQEKLNERIRRDEEAELKRR